MLRHGNYFTNWAPRCKVTFQIYITLRSPDNHGLSLDKAVLAYPLIGVVL